MEEPAAPYERYRAALSRLTLPVRPASKSLRCVTALQRISSADDRYRGVLCLTADEAVALSSRSSTTSSSPIRPGSPRTSRRSARPSPAAPASP